ncbi:MAG: acetate/propionate family kinase [Actinomycetota bacterium]|jgi:acetate kinase|nr:acetate/propionate family kinase [Actinomycetota bacterium]
MLRRVFVVNAGSSSVKLRTVEPDGSICARADLGPPGPDLADRLGTFLDASPPPHAVGHRVVHGGTRFTGPVVINRAVRYALDELREIAPLHNPPALAAIDAVGKARPELPAVACFDTAFHGDLPPEASTYALPARWRQDWGLRRFGFHGLSCSWAVRRVHELTGGGADRQRLVICHLGAGASVTAVLGGRSVDTTMGYTPLEGLVMATRSGDVDPGILLWALGHGMSSADLEHSLENASGLAGLVEKSGGDFRLILQRRTNGDPEAALALDVYLHRLRAKIAAMAAAAGGIDVLVFTGGVGEHAAQVRSDCCNKLTWLDIAIDPDANNAVGDADADISTPAARVRTFVVQSREELVIAELTRQALGESDKLS